ncbi:MAG: STAS domain-containing protein [Bacteroidia bacterium]|nr:STAS domain-containing protein [Bacteroidia bacterium]
MECEILKQAGYTVMRLQGRLNTLSCKRFEESVNKVINEQITNILFDLRDLIYINSTGLKILFYTLRKQNDVGKKLVIFGISDNVLEKFDIAGFLPIFTILNNEEEALSALN